MDKQEQDRFFAEVLVGIKSDEFRRYMAQEYLPPMPTTIRPEFRFSTRALEVAYKAIESRASSHS